MFDDRTVKSILTCTDAYAKAIGTSARAEIASTLLDVLPEQVPSTAALAPWKGANISALDADSVAEMYAYQAYLLREIDTGLVSGTRIRSLAAATVAVTADDPETRREWLRAAAPVIADLHTLAELREVIEYAEVDSAPVDAEMREIADLFNSERD